MLKIYIYINDDGVVQSWGSTRSDEIAIEIDVDDNHPLLSNPPKLFRYIDGQIVKDDSIIMARAKVNKDAELNLACKQAILDGFLHNINGQDYWFSFDHEAQLNFQGSKTILDQGLLPSLEWTVRVGGIKGEYSRVSVTKEIMNQLTIAIIMHKNDKISKYRDIMLPLLGEVTTMEEINAIKWEFF